MHDVPIRHEVVLQVLQRYGLWRIFKQYIYILHSIDYIRKHQEDLRGPQCNKYKQGAQIAPQGVFTLLKR